MKRPFAAMTLAAAVLACPLAQAKAYTPPCATDASGPGPGRFADAIACYRHQTEAQALQYAMTDTTRVADVEQRTYRMVSQSWSPERLVQPEEWLHDVTIYVPDEVTRHRALLVVNNGTRRKKDGTGPIAPTDLTPEALAGIAKATRTAIVSVSDVPNQSLVYTDDGGNRAEDESVAHSWSLFMNAPQQRPSMPLQVPMVASASRAMTLAERELAPYQIHRFIVTGASKRAWAGWLTAITDPRVDAVVSFAADVLGTHDTLKSMYRSYGGNWPIAFAPFYAEGIDKRIDTPEFASLADIIDPLAYRRTRYGARLGMPKYLVNASGDDFFVPDNAALYYDKLPGRKALRMVPNAAHRDIRGAIVGSLTPFLNRFQSGTSLPRLDARLRGTGADASIVLHASEPPKQLLLWSATNPNARDFRYACGVRYTSTPIDVPAGGIIRVPVSQPEAGWSAYFVEATFADGFVATSQAYVLGKQAYPTAAPPTNGPACQTLPGRLPAS
ncbi:PhoPQ-activated pathogenicity-related family protein [Ralstonia solanacearum]|nr:PhoPQ-activated pathogenicity-related family protein [Ralstonia solanacearum]